MDKAEMMERMLQAFTDVGNAVMDGCCTGHKFEALTSVMASILYFSKTIDPGFPAELLCRLVDILENMDRIDVAAAIEAFKQDVRRIDELGDGDAKFH